MGIHKIGMSRAPPVGAYDLPKTQEGLCVKNKQSWIQSHTGLGGTAGTHGKNIGKEQDYDEGLGWVGEMESEQEYFYSYDWKHLEGTLQTSLTLASNSQQLVTVGPSEQAMSSSSLNDLMVSSKIDLAYVTVLPGMGRPDSG